MIKLYNTKEEDHNLNDDRFRFAVDAHHELVAIHRVPEPLCAVALDKVIAEIERAIQPTSIQ